MPSQTRMIKDLVEQHGLYVLEESDRKYKIRCFNFQVSAITTKLRGTHWEICDMPSPTDHSVDTKSQRMRTHIETFSVPTVKPDTETPLAEPHTTTPEDKCLPRTTESAKKIPTSTKKKSFKDDKELKAGNANVNDIHSLGKTDTTDELNLNGKENLGLKKNTRNRKLDESHYLEAPMPPTQVDQSQVRPERAPIQATGSSEPMSFTHKPSGALIHILVYNITELHVDAIVNAANDKLIHGGGVAKAISDAAGPSLKSECQSFIKKSGLIKVSNNAVTKAGYLPCKAIIHAVGPQMAHYRKEPDMCFKFLYGTFVNCLTSASDLGFLSIAIPAISSGKSVACSHLWLYQSMLSICGSSL